MAKTKSRPETPVQDVVPEFPFSVAELDGEFDQPNAPPAEASPPKPPELAKPQAPEVPQPPSILVELPIAVAPPEHYRFNHLDLHLDVEHREIFRSIYEGCLGKRLATGRPVASAADVVRYWLDQCRAASVAS